MLGIDPKTVKSVVTDLETLGMVRRDDFVRYSEIIPLPITEIHLALFQPSPKAERAKAAERAASQEPTYILKGDDYDDCRMLCMKVMPQEVAEDVIHKARLLGDDCDAFEQQFESARAQHEKNILSGKIAEGNFGAYLAKRYQTRLKKLQEQERREEAAERLEAHQKTPQGKVAEAERRKAIAADPMHLEHKVGNDSILARVQFSDNALTNLREVDKVLSQLHRHVAAFLAPQHLPTQQEVDLGGNMRFKILRAALAKVNHHYGTPTLATGNEFREAIDEAIRESYSAMKPIWAAKESKPEVAHA